MRAQDFGVRVIQGLAPVGKVAGDARDGEEDGEKGGREAHRTVHQARVKVDVGVQLPVDKVGVGARDALQLHRDVDQRVAPSNGKHLIRELADLRRARVKVLVHAVPKSKQLLLFGLDALQKLWDVLHAANARQHAQHRLVGSPVQRTVQRAHRPRDGDEHVHAAAREVAHRGGGAVHLVLRVQNEHNVHCAGQLRVGLIAGGPHRIEHVQKVFRVGEVLVGLARPAAGPAMIRVRRQRGHLPQQSHNLFVANLGGTVNGAASKRGVLLRVVAAQRGDAGNKDRHRVRVMR
mmetsp:Transcript_2581/g.4624  ORF Transcript_2581/g.4624 Transcript_2581/m.4624 type:complete len:291 (-) Transcript_2581:701-1573(-)